MYIIKYTKEELEGLKVSPVNIITNEFISFQVEGTGSVKLETSIDGDTWHENANIKDVVAPCYVEISDCIIGNRIRLTTTEAFKEINMNL